MRVLIILAALALSGCASSLAQEQPVEASTSTMSADMFATEADQAAYIRQVIVDYFPETYPTMLAIAYCETRSRPFVHLEPDGSLRGHDEGLSSSSGAFQVLLNYHGEAIASQGLNMRNIDDYMTFVRYLYDTGRHPFSPWAESRSCWQSRIGQFDPLETNTAEPIS